MPNHCHNDLYISGPAEEVAALLSRIGADKEEPEFNFNAVIPYPEEFAAKDREMEALGWGGFREKYGDQAKDGFNSGGYEWCLVNWGTKWGAYEVERRDYLGVCVTFQTAWSPASAIIQALHKLHPGCSLHLEYFERGAEKCGGFSCLAKDDWYEDEPWTAGAKARQWSGAYRGNRGG